MFVTALERLPVRGKQHRSRRHQRPRRTALTVGAALKGAGRHDRDAHVRVLFLVHSIVRPGCANDIFDDPAVALGNDPRHRKPGRSVRRPPLERLFQRDRNFRQELIAPCPL